MTDVYNHHLVNLTPHPVVVRALDGCLVEVPASGRVARVEYESRPLFQLRIGGRAVAVDRRRAQFVVELPVKQENTFFVVSRLVADHTQRADLLVPGPVERDSLGRPMFCRGLLTR